MRAFIYLYANVFSSSFFILHSARERGKNSAKKSCFCQGDPCIGLPTGYGRVEGYLQPKGTNIPRFTTLCVEFLIEMLPLFTVLNCYLIIFQVMVEKRQATNFISC